MGTELMIFEDFGVAACMAFAAMGSALGTGNAAMGALGAWKKCFAQNKSAPFLLTIFVGFPLSQTIYGMVLMNNISTAAAAGHPLLWIGLFGGLGMGVSAMMQGKAAASACDALAETGKGASNYIIALGIIETVALFVMAFLMSKISVFTG
ncbi:V-type ATP synthase subunit K [hydrothermal vent metagenome]|uniref:V-type ATP synthase subunit K n=1 Tax=hydrothermal vent metagenome TaxID=652676 RepID=A0A3B1DF74_9ZZZZ